MMKKENFISICGILIIALSIWLATSLQYRHFYEFMLIGIFLVLYPSTRIFFTTKTFFILYAIFFVFGGLIEDLFFGIIIGEVWYYNYYSILEYASLYLIIYPIGGLVMIMSFLFFIKNYKIKRKRSSIFQTKLLGYLSLLSTLFVILFIVLKYYYNVIHSSFFIAAFSWLFISLFFNYVAAKRKRFPFINILLLNPKKIILATLFATYINAFLHEFPNLFAQQWVYQNLIFEETKFIGIPIIVLIGWLALTVFPVSAYYSIKHN